MFYHKTDVKVFTKITVDEKQKQISHWLRTMADNGTLTIKRLLHWMTKMTVNEAESKGV